MLLQTTKPSIFRTTYGRFVSRQRVVSLALVFCLVVFLYNPELLFHVKPSRPARTLLSHHEEFEVPLTAPNATELDGEGLRGQQGRPASCRGWPDLSDIVIIVKTGASEAFDKVPIQLMTFLRCVPDNVLIFSDMEEDLGPHHIYDSLDEVAEEVKTDNKDFDLYRAQNEYKLAGQDVRLLRKADWVKDAAWNLDKYKNVHVAEKTFRLRPSADWYIYIDADSYIVWPSLLAFLARLDPSKQRYLGSVAMMGDMGFAHGGSGYMLSGAAMRQLVGTDNTTAARFDVQAKNECCGDVILAKAIYEKNMKLDQAWPMINGEKPNTLPYGPSHWCQPVVTMHHISADEVSEMWQYEQQRKDPSQPILLSDIYHTFMKPKLLAERDDWDNISNDQTYKDPIVLDEDEKKDLHKWTSLQHTAHRSYEDCALACKEEKSCFQFKYSSDKVCGLSNSFRVGARHVPGSETQMRSGWDLGRIEDWIREKGECTSPQWVI